MKMVDIQRMDDGACLHYKPTNEPKGSGELKNLICLANKAKANSFNAWNQLPEDVVMAPSLNVFKGQLNKHWSRHTSKFTATCLAQQPDI